jgi:hypothetical protein
LVNASYDGSHSYIRLGPKLVAPELLRCGIIYLPMKKSKKNAFKEDSFIDEDVEWVKLTPAQRMLETTKLWKLYVALGGSLDPEPDPQSPFRFK